MSTWDVVVIGGGPPGENAAQYAIQGSDRTAVIVEQDLLGGECSFWACVPSKAMLRPVELFDQAQEMPGVRQRVSGAIDVPAVLARRDEFTHNRDDAGQVRWADGVGVEVLRGRGRLAGERSVELTAADGTRSRLDARHAVVLATGSSAAIPPVEGLREALPWTSRDVTNLREVPRRVLAIGGGVVACEATTWLRALGAQEITIVEREPALLGNQEPFAGKLVAEEFAKRGIRVLLGAELGAIDRPGAADTGVGMIHGGPASVTVGEDSFEVDEIVVAAGRKPVSDELGLELVGVRADAHGYLKSDEHMTLAGEWLYSVGDVRGPALLTHMGKYQARIAGDVIAARAEGRGLDGSRYRDLADDGIVPAVVFTDPQVASVGMTESAAREQRRAVQALELDFSAVSGAALLRDGYAGRAKLVVDQDTETILGATFVGTDVAELLHSATVAIAGKVTLDALWHAVPSFPTISEIWLRLLESRR